MAKAVEMLLAGKPDAETRARDRLDPGERQAEHRAAAAPAYVEVGTRTVDAEEEPAAFGGIV